MIPVNEPLLNGNEKKYLCECIDSGWISSEGPFVRRFEEEFAAYHGRKYGIAVANGSGALDVAVAALELAPGDEVIMPALTIISCALSVVRAGAVPVLVDSDPATWNIKPDLIEEKITPRTNAIMPVHHYGQPADMDPILALAEKYGLKVIEDSAEAIGQTYKGRHCGNLGTISTFSFYPNKHVTTGEGGMILTNDEKLARRCRSFRNLCFPEKRQYIHEDMGWNYRMSNLQAALGVAQLEKLSATIRKKRHIGKYYTALLQDVGGITLPVQATNYAENIYWIYGIVLQADTGLNNLDFCQRLAEYKIGTRYFFTPMHKQPVWKKRGLFTGESYPVSEFLSKMGFYIPTGVGLTDSQIEEVVKTIREILRHG